MNPPTAITGIEYAIYQAKTSSGFAKEDLTKLDEMLAALNKMLVKYLEPEDFT
jgi:hypothetical protein